MITILLADDEEMLRTLVALTLGDDPRYRVLQAKDGEETLELARRERPALIFLDVNMPRLDGYEVCRRLKADPATRDIRVYMLTAKDTPEDCARGLAAGADGYFVKPFSPLTLLAKVEEVLG